MTHILHINDNNLCLVSGGQVHRSQGYAWMKDGAVVFDVGHDEHAPVRVCRLAPQEVNSRYWQQCAQSTIASNASGMRHAADLIWNHLTQLKQALGFDALILVVPSHYQSSNLQLLLGIAKTCGITISAVINKAVLALHDRVVEDGAYQHIDVQLHQTVFSQVTVDNGVAKLGHVDVISAVGLLAMQDAVLKAVQHNFIQSDRFDPLHYAETEQQLFDCLSGSAEQIRGTGKALISVHHNGQSYRTNIEKTLWDDTLSGCMQDVLERAASVRAKTQSRFVDINNVFDGHELGIFTNAGLIAVLGLADIKQTLDEQKTIAGASIIYVTEVPLVNNEAKRGEVFPSAENKKPVSTSVTHLVLAGVAVAIEYADIDMSNQNLAISMKAQGNATTLLKSGKLYIINDDSRADLRPNDRLGSHFSDGVITAVQVLS